MRESRLDKEKITRSHFTTRIRSRTLETSAASVRSTVYRNQRREEENIEVVRTQLMTLFEAVIMRINPGWAGSNQLHGARRIPRDAAALRATLPLTSAGSSVKSRVQKWGREKLSLLKYTYF